MAEKMFTEVETKLLTTVLESAARDGSFNSLCDWDAIAAKLRYGTAKSARDSWNRLSAKKLKSDAGANGTTTSASPKKRKNISDVDKDGVKSPSPTKRNRKTKQEAPVEMSEMEGNVKVKNA